MNKIILTTCIIFTVFCSCKKTTETEEISFPIETEKVVGLGRVVPMGGISNLAAPATGIVTSLNCKEGEHITKGQIILSIDSEEIRLSVIEAEARLQEAKQKLQAIRRQLDDQRINIKLLKKESEDLFFLAEHDAVTIEKRDNKKQELDRATIELERLKSLLEAEQQLVKINTALLENQKLQLQNTSFKAPQNGTILTLLPKIGEAVNRYQTYVSFAPDTSLVVEAEIDEFFASKIKPGMKCDIKLVGFKENLCKGELYQISPEMKLKSIFSDSGDELEDRRVRSVLILLEETNKQLLINSKAECIVYLK